MSNPFTQGQTLLREHQAFITRTARSLAYSYPTAEQEDIEQEIAFFLWEEEEDFLSRGCSDAYVRVCIRNVGLNYALRMRDQTFLSTDSFFYAVDEIEELLPKFLSGSLGADSESYGSWRKGASALEVHADLSLAWDLLSDSQQEVLTLKFHEDAELDTTQRKALSRALKKFTDTLNNKKNQQAREYQGTGTRKTLSRSASVEAVAV